MLSIVNFGGKSISSIIRTYCVLRIIKVNTRSLTLSTHYQRSDGLLKCQASKVAYFAPAITQIIQNRKKSYAANRQPREEKHKTEDFVEELSKCTTELEILQFLIEFEPTKLGKKLLGSTTKTLYHRLKRSESVHQTILHCIERLYNPKTTQHHLAHLDSKTLIRLIEILITLKAPEDHLTLQSALAVIKNKLSHHRGYTCTLSIHDIVHIEYLLQQISDYPQAAEIHTLLPLSFEIRLNSQVASDDLEMLLHETEDLDWNLLLSETDNVVQSIVTDIIRQRFPLNVYKAFNFFLFIADCCDISLITEPEKLLTILFDTLTSKVDSLNPQEIELLLRVCADKCRGGDNAFYNYNFVEALVNKYMDDAGYPSSSVINAVSTMGHMSQELLDRLSKMVSSDPDMLQDPATLVSFVHLFSTLGKQPRSRDFDFESKIIEAACTKIHDPQNSLTLLIDLLALDYGKRGKHLVDLLRKAFSPKYIQMKSSIESGLLSYDSTPLFLLLVITAVRNFLGVESQHLLPSNDIVQKLEESAKSLAKNWRYPLMNSLEFALGGPTYVATGLWSQGLHIDHCVLVEEPGGCPAVIEDKFTLNDSLNKIPILVKVHPKMHYLASERRLKGMYELELKILKNLGHPLIEIDLFMWDKMQTEEEKAFWLIQRIKECFKSRQTPTT